MRSCVYAVGSMLVGSSLALAQNPPPKAQNPAAQNPAAQNPAAQNPAANQQQTPQFNYPGSNYPFGPKSSAPLFQYPGVSKELKLTDEQMQQLQKAYSDFNRRYVDEFGRLKKVPDPQREARLQELQQAYTANWQQAMGNIFQQQQRSRYQQLERQYRGLNALQDGDVLKSLNLNKAQMTELERLRLAADKELQAIQELGQTNAAQATQRYELMRRETMNHLGTILTPEQQQLWADMIGQPFPFVPTFGTPPARQ